jgi:hypothetical protein
MNEINELWISPWRKLHQDLAIEFAVESLRNGMAAGTADPGAHATVMPSASWLARARSREAPISKNCSTTDR